MRRHRKSQAYKHAARIALNRRIEKLLDFRKSHDLIQLAPHLLPGHAQNRPVEISIFPPGQVGMKTRAHLQQAGDAAFDLDEPAGWGGDLRQNFEQSAFAGPIAADDTQRLPLLNGEAHIPQRPEGLVIAIAMVYLTNLEKGIGFTTFLGPPNLKIIRQPARADLAQAIEFGEVFDGNNCIAHTVSMNVASTRLKINVPMTTTTSINPKLYARSGRFTVPAPPR